MPGSLELKCPKNLTLPLLNSWIAFWVYSLTKSSDWLKHVCRTAIVRAYINSDCSLQSSGIQQWELYTLYFKKLSNLKWIVRFVFFNICVHVSVSRSLRSAADQPPCCSCLQCLQWFMSTFLQFALVSSILCSSASSCALEVRDFVAFNKNDITWVVLHQMIVVSCLGHVNPVKLNLYVSFSLSSLFVLSQWCSTSFCMTKGKAPSGT